jgi:RNA polymerase sigma-70 factor (ECF subfamily)
MTDADAQIATLADRLRAGEEGALADEFSQHRERLWKLVQFRLDRRLLGRVDADDILQEAYLDAAQRVQHFLDGPEVLPFVWLRGIVNQTMIDVHRRHLGAKMRDAGREVSIHRGGHAQATSVSLAAGLLGDVTSPSEAAMRNETSASLEQAIARMDPVDQEILALRHFEELTNAEIAEVLGLQQKAASIRYVRAIRRLKKVLGSFPELGGEAKDKSP